MRILNFYKTVGLHPESLKINTSQKYDFGCVCCGSFWALSVEKSFSLYTLSKTKKITWSQLLKEDKELIDRILLSREGLFTQVERFRLDVINYLLSKRRALSELSQDSEFKVFLSSLQAHSKDAVTAEQLLGALKKVEDSILNKMIEDLQGSAREKLLLRQLGTIKTWANKRGWDHHTREELASEGILALAKELMNNDWLGKFDPDKAKFQSYYAKRVFGAMVNYLCQSSIKLPVIVKQIYKKVHLVKQDYLQKNGFEVSADKLYPIVKELLTEKQQRTLKVDHVQLAMDFYCLTISAIRPGSEEPDSSCFIDTLGKGQAIEFEDDPVRDQILAEEKGRQLRAIIDFTISAGSKINKIGASIVKTLQLSFKGYKDEQIAEELNIEPNTVRQNNIRGTRRLKLNSYCLYHHIDMKDPDMTDFLNKKIVEWKKFMATFKKPIANALRAEFKNWQGQGA